MDIRGDMTNFVKWKNFTNMSSHISTNFNRFAEIFYSPSNLDLYKNTGIKIVKFAWSTNFAAWIIVNYIDE